MTNKNPDPQLTASVTAPESRSVSATSAGIAAQASAAGVPTAAAQCDVTDGLAAAPATAAEQPVAILVCHGMGQQVPFETLDCVAKSIARAEHTRHHRTPTIDVRLVKLGDQQLPRAEMRVTTAAGRTREVHLYEAYWAPLTEGKVTARDVTGFLLDAYRRGLRYARAGTLTRHLFGEERRFPLPRFSAMQLQGVFAIVCLVWALFFAIWLAAPVWLVVNAWAAAAGTVAPWKVAAAGVLWALLAIGSARVRRLYFQYAGDVAAYVSSHKVNRFSEVRSAVKKVGLDLARAVYGARRGDGGEEYGQVYVVGHSLGSVVAYDTLNAMLNEDLLSPEEQRLHVRDRTPLLLTFGSPLDKTAFIFRAQLHDAPVREALAAAMQPLIQKYELRPDHWVNIHAPADPVSGPLSFYDTPNAGDCEFPGRRVINLKDPLARTPLAAHTQYWNNPLLGDVLHNVLSGKAPAPATAPAAEPAVLPAGAAVAR